MKKLVLLILDGWGLGSTSSSMSAIAQARTPFIDSLYVKYPYARLRADGSAVGLPEGQMGNSEVGHMHIGAGRVIPQALLSVNQAVKQKSLQTHPRLVQFLKKLKKENKWLHIVGLLSDGGVHSHINHLMALCDTAHKHAIKKVFIHGFTDGRDCAPQSAIGYVRTLKQHLSDKPNIHLTTLMGRYYGMDRDKRWHRTRLAYDALMGDKIKVYSKPEVGIEAAYACGTTDEFLKPFRVASDNQIPYCPPREGDGLLCFNFRGDRMRQLLNMFTNTEARFHKALRIVTLTEYDARLLSKVGVLYCKSNLSGTLGEVLAKHQKRQWRIAETEKYPHVTYFFSGGREDPFFGEKRILCPSPTDVPTYDLRPEMSALDVCKATLEVIQNPIADFVCVNLANPDMVGHTGVFSAVVKACEVVDQCSKQIAIAAKKKNYTLCITADHGNAECMKNKKGKPHTAHTSNFVPFIVLDKRIVTLRQTGELADIAPTVLELMGLSPSPEMKGQSLCKRV